MRASVPANTWMRLARIRRAQRVQNIATISLFVLGPVLAFLTYLVLGPLQEGATSPKLRLILLADFVYVLLVASLVLQGVARMVAARRRKSAGSRLHLRLTGVFALLALIPTILVAVFAALTVNVGLEGWFSERVQQVVGNSQLAAQAYEQEHRRDLILDAEALARFLNRARIGSPFLSDGSIRKLLTDGQTQIQRGLREAYVIDGKGEIRSRGERSYLFDYEPPDPALFEAAKAGESVVIRDWDINEFRALIHLSAYVDRYLYVTRDVDGEILNLLDETQETVRLYNQLEADRGKLLLEFGLLYLGFAVILVLGAIWLGMWFAERLAAPVGRLAGAAQRVGAGDLDVQVLEDEGDDEIAMVGRLFNQMTRQLKGQRQTLLENNQQIEDRRRMFDSVLSSVTSGVLGLDPDGRVTFVNRAAEKMLDMQANRDDPGTISDVAVEFCPLFERLRNENVETAEQELRLIRRGKQENLLVRMATMRSTEQELEGYVVAFEDVTDLVSAQRMAAWGDVARRIAHEIKNPLTPIQLSAERLKRKFGPLVGDQSADLDQYADVIIRQTNDLRRIVDEFSKFARMPRPERRLQDLTKLVSDVVLLQRNGQPDVKITLESPDQTIKANLDATMFGQALTNVIKNAGEAIETRIEKSGENSFEPTIKVTLEGIGDMALVTVSDNGVGLPDDRSRLLEPYVTTRAAGTGLGLPIVKKIIQEHGGTLTMLDAEPFGNDGHTGARIEIQIPLDIHTENKVRAKESENEDK